MTDPAHARGGPAEAGALGPEPPAPRREPPSVCQLVADVGNTDIVFGLLGLSGEPVVDHWRVSARVPRTEAEHRVLLASLLAPVLAKGVVVQRGVVGSVVPSVTRPVAAAASSVVDGPVVVASAESDLPIVLDVEEPLTVGADRIVNTLAAKVRFARDTIAVDLGTATTFDCITAQGVFRGGVIAPGVGAGLDWLATRTAQLPKVDLTPPLAVVGRRTAECIRSGVFHSAVASVNGIVAKLKKEWAGADPLVVATGGFAPLIAPHASSVDRIEPFLTLHGLGIAGAYLDPR